MARLKHQGRQSQTEKEFGDILCMADPIVSRFVSEHEALGRRNEALRERVTVLERALEELADPLGWPPSLRDRDFVIAMRQVAREALDG